MDIEQSKWRCKELTKEAHAGWIGISNQIAIETVLNTMYKSIEETAYYRDLVKLERKEKEQLKKSLKGQIKKKDLIINEMATTLSSVCTGIDVIIEQFNKKYCEFINSDEDCCWKTDKECSDCIKEYFTKKVEGK